MWTKLSHIIIKYRLLLVLVLVGITIFMGYHARNVEMSYNLSSTVPTDDPDMVEFMQFKELFGEDGNLMAIGLKDSSVYTAEKFEKLRAMSNELNRLTGVNNVVSLPLIKRLKKDTAQRQFVLEPVFTNTPSSIQEFDSLLQVALDQRFYTGRL
ncbi:MAG: hypothetical protein AAF693_04620, partial [Bacteroidota bacterium]